MKFDPSPTAIWKKYERDRDYKRSIGLYDRVRRNEAFYLGRQWEGLRVQSLDPLIFNVLRRCVNLFVAMLVSDDVAVRAQPFDMDEDGRQTAHVLERAFASAIERSGVKALGRPLLKNACVDGDACFYMHFDPALETGQAVKGDIAVELIDSTNICFGNAACDEVQRQPYIIIAMRRDADEVRREARANGISASDAETIRPDDSGEYHRYRTSADGERVTVLLHMRRTENGIAFCKTTRNAVVMPEKVLPYRLYPVTHLCWNRVRGSCHGESPLTEAIPNQIAINKLYSMYVQCIKQVAFPKIVYDMTRFPNGWSNDVGKAIGMRGNPNDAIAAAFRAPDISAQVLQLLKQMMTDTAELMGASEAALGTVNPDNTSAIIAVQNATAAPLELTKMEFYRFTEDWARVFLDLMGAHYGVRTLVLPNEDGGEPETCTFDFSALAGQDMRLQVDVGAASYWSETMQTMTNDHLLESGVISDPLVYLENVPDYQVRGKHDLLHALRVQQQQQKEANSNAENSNES
ncbi:hypothetical protein DWV55_00790 [Butyricicoccus sp. AF10-3]|nr:MULTISPECIES: hypothetical protein [unclassified Butyricicoccus]RHS38539.1 hypothetical protein DWV55_00790 [Butyricicoccus sp. AF10-3]